MRYTLTALILASTLAVSGMALAAPPQASPAAAKAAPAATHSVQGVVKSVDSTSLMITRSGTKGGEMSFKLD